MELTCKVVSILPVQEFSSKGEVKSRHSFVVEHGQYNKKAVFTVFGSDKFAQLGLVVGGSYNISFDVESREYNGRWYTDLRAWKAVRLS